MDTSVQQDPSDFADSRSAKASPWSKLFLLPPNSLSIFNSPFSLPLAAEALEGTLYIVSQKKQFEQHFFFFVTLAWRDLDIVHVYIPIAYKGRLTLRDLARHYLINLIHTYWRRNLRLPLHLRIS